MIPKRSSLVLILILACALTARADAPTTAVRAVADGSNRFAIDLYRSLATKRGNLFFSPHSIHAALAMAHAGARGETAAEMAKALHFPGDGENPHTAYHALLESIRRSHEGTGLELAVANALWPQAGYPLRPALVDLMRTDYVSVVEPLDFRTHPDGARHRINSWVESQTHQRIRGLVGPGVLSGRSRLVLSNAIYFKGAWDSAFSAQLTRPEPFHLSARMRVDVPTMSQITHVRYAETPSVQVVELPYRGNEVVMDLVIPKKIDGLANGQPSVTASALSSWLDSLSAAEIELHLPKFRLEREFRLEDRLRRLGIARAFDRSAADFDGLFEPVPDERFWISAMLHKAWVEVNEEGTEAAAASAVVVDSHVVSAQPPPIVVRADRPFLFLIRHESTGAILFLGRLADARG